MCVDIGLVVVALAVRVPVLPSRSSAAQPPPCPIHDPVRALSVQVTPTAIAEQGMLLQTDSMPTGNCRCCRVCCAGMLEGMSRIEADAYQLLTMLGATPVTRVLTAGGGAVNDKWTAMRAAALGVPVAAAAQGMTQQQCHLCGQWLAIRISLDSVSSGGHVHHQ